MASTSRSTGTDTTDLATTSSCGGNTVTEEDQSDADSGSLDSDSQEGARKVKSLMSVLRCPSHLRSRGRENCVLTLLRGKMWLQMRLF